jgi:hypothetical protein
VRVLVLDVGLFRDREAVQAAVTQLAEGNEVRRRNAPAAGAADSEWDQVLAEVLAADLVVTL